jgi:hypothetical protein
VTIQRPPVADLDDVGVADGVALDGAVRPPALALVERTRAGVAVQDPQRGVLEPGRQAVDACSVQPATDAQAPQLRAQVDGDELPDGLGCVVVSAASGGDVPTDVPGRVGGDVDAEVAAREVPLPLRGAPSDGEAVEERLRRQPAIGGLPGGDVRLGDSVGVLDRRSPDDVLRRFDRGSPIAGARSLVIADLPSVGRRSLCQWPDGPQRRKIGASPAGGHSPGPDLTAEPAGSAHLLACRWGS